MHQITPVTAPIDVIDAGRVAHRRRRTRSPAASRWAVLVAGALWPILGLAAGDAPGTDGVVAGLMTKDLVGDPSKEIVMITVEYLPGGASLPHRHDAQVFVFVLEGALRMQVRGAPVLTLRKGQTFYEGPEDIHEVSANASLTEPARILVFLVKEKSKPGSRPATG